MELAQPWQQPFGGSPRCRHPNDTPVEFKFEFKEPELKPYPSVPVGIGTFNLECSNLVSRTQPRHREGSDLLYRMLSFTQQYKLVFSA